MTYEDITKNVYIRLANVTNERLKEIGKEISLDIKKKLVPYRKLMSSLNNDDINMDEVTEMDNSWHKLDQFANETYPQKEDYYLVVCVEPNGRGLGNYYRAVAYYDCLEGFNTKEAIVSYWKEVDWPNDFPIK